MDDSNFLVILLLQKLGLHLPLAFPSEGNSALPYTEELPGFNLNMEYLSKQIIKTN